MQVRNFSAQERAIIDEYVKLVESIPVVDAAEIELYPHEFDVLLNHLGLKVGLFRPVPSYRGITLRRKPFLK